MIHVATPEQCQHLLHRFGWSPGETAWRYPDGRRYWLVGLQALAAVSLGPVGGQQYVDGRFRRRLPLGGPVLLGQF